MLRLKSGKSEVLNESGREFHGFEAVYEKECKQYILQTVETKYNYRVGYRM